MTGPAVDLAPPHPTFARTLRLQDVILLNVLAVLSLRWITRGATAGAPAPLLWLLAFAVFAVPLVAAVGLLTRRYPEEGGLYVWTRRAFGPLHGFICGWSYWICNIVYFPSVLLFAAPNVLTVFGDAAREVAASRAYGVGFVLAMLVLSLVLATAGWRASRRLHVLGGLALWVPVLALIIAAVVTLAHGVPATSFTTSNMRPMADPALALGLWSSMCFAFAGFEVAGLVPEEVERPERTIPRGLVVSSAMVAIAYILGSTSVLVVLPARTVAEQTGIADALGLVGQRFGIPASSGIAGLLIALGLVATTSVYFGAAARVPFAVGIDRMLPRALARQHPRYRTPHVALAVQALAAALLLLVSLFFTVTGVANSLQESYDVLVGIAVITTLIPYLYLFAALVRLVPGRPAGESPRRRHAIRVGVVALGGVGFGTTALAIALTLMPPPGVRQVVNYVVGLLVQTGFLLAVGLVFYARAARGGSAGGPRHSAGGPRL